MAVAAKGLGTGLVTVEDRDDLESDLDLVSMRVSCIGA